MARVIAIQAETAQAESACSGAEPIALMVLGDSMLPEFAEGEVIVIEPDGMAEDGSFVLAHLADDWMLRQLVRDGDSWRLRALNPTYPEHTCTDLDAVKGVVIRKVRPGRRRESKNYVC